jgi:ABC-type multidrug transport system fused ATPase/permease subunit
MLLVRRSAPEGSRFADGDRAAGIFGVIATGFSVLLGLIVFLAFESYDQSRSGAEAEARLVVQQFETAQFMPIAVRQEFGNELVCYARFVVHDWARLESADEDTVDTANPWGAALFRTLKATHPRNFTEQTAYDKWMDRNADRENARSDRIHGAVGVIPGTLWLVLLFITAVIFVFMLFFADSAERAVVQAMMVGSVIAVIAATLLLIQALDDPFRDGFGGLKPVAMERTQRILDTERRTVGDTGTLPCDANGRPLR